MLVLSVIRKSLASEIHHNLKKNALSHWLFNGGDVTTYSPASGDKELLANIEYLGLKSVHRMLAKHA